LRNFIELSPRLGETTKIDVGKRVLREQGNVARVEPLRFIEVDLAPVPLALPAGDRSQ
jgi:hypothetical protein